MGAFSLIVVINLLNRSMMSGVLPDISLNIPINESENSSNVSQAGINSTLITGVLHSEPKTCSQCTINIENNELFFCYSCSRDDNKPESQRFYCKNCAVVHMRVTKHPIVNSEGREVAVCHKHKNLALNFCKSCKVTFCWDCSNMHEGAAGHVNVSLACKDDAIRYQYEERKELVAKRRNLLARVHHFKSQINSEIVENNNVKYDFNKISQELSAKIEETMQQQAGVKREFSCVDDSCNEVLNLMNTKENLPPQEIERAFTEAEKLLSEWENAELSTHTVFRPAKIQVTDGDIVHVLHKALVEFIKPGDIKYCNVELLTKGQRLFPKVKSKNDVSGLLIRDRCLNGKITNVTNYGHGKLSVCELEGGKRKNKPMFLKDIHLSGIKSAYAFNGLIVLETRDLFQLVDLVQVSGNRLTKQVNEQEFIVFVIGKGSGCDENDFDTIKWHDTAKCLLFQDKQLDCPSLPKCLDYFYTNNSDILACVDYENNVHVYNLTMDSHAKLGWVEHGLQSVDEIQFLGNNMLFLYETESKKISVIFQRFAKSGEAFWTFLSVHKLHTDSNYFNVFEFGEKCPKRFERNTDPHICDSKCCGRGEAVEGDPSGKRKNCCVVDLVHSEEMIFENKYYLKFTGCRHLFNDSSDSEDSDV